MDLARADDEESATADFIAAQTAELDDFSSFAARRRDISASAPRELSDITCAPSWVLARSKKSSST